MPAAPEDELEFEFLAPESLSSLKYQQKILYQDHWGDFLAYLRTKGKNPRKHDGYEESNIRPLARRVHQVFTYYWKSGRIVLELTPEDADHFLDALNRDDVTRNDGVEYSEGSKRKFNNSLQAYFRFVDKEWEPEISFSDEPPTLPSDPFTRQERESLLNAAFDLHSPPSYSNLSPEERDRWKGYIAQYIGKPKSEVTRSDWEELERSWKIAALIATALDAGWRVEMVGRLETSLIDIENQRIIIPPDIAVKNDEKWVVELSLRSSKILEKWLIERANKVKYDSSDKIWLNREGNKYNSSNLNNLLRNLIDEAGINPDGRKLTWHSIRHSTGMYVYDRERDLALVAEILRHKSLESARKYAHPTPETKRDVIESIQGGV